MFKGAVARSRENRNQRKASAAGAQRVRQMQGEMTLERVRRVQIIQNFVGLVKT